MVEFTGLWKELTTLFPGTSIYWAAAIAIPPFLFVLWNTFALWMTVRPRNMSKQLRPYLLLTGFLETSSSDERLPPKPEGEAEGVSPRRQLALASASHGLEQRFEAEHFSRYNSIIELVPVVSLALTVFSLVYVIPMMGQEGFAAAFASKLKITFVGMILLAFFSWYLIWVKTRFFRNLQRLKEKLLPSNDRSLPNGGGQ